MEIPFYQIDAFTSRVFSGNPAGVCFLDFWPDDCILQAIAFENSLSETAFLVWMGSDYELRWFTPTVEVDLCGHATLAGIASLDYFDVMVTAPGKESDFVSRFFAPREGIPEDPVTGSAHCTLIPYWSARLGKRDLYALQLSQRGGEIFCLSLIHI